MMTSGPSPIERKYRVWVEKHESGWIEVMAPSEDIAKDRAQDEAQRHLWYPERSHSSPLVAEEITHD